jgi:hypothetical protein
LLNERSGFLRGGLRLLTWRLSAPEENPLSRQNAILKAITADGPDLDGHRSFMVLLRSANGY